MLRLVQQKEPYELDLGVGVKLTVRPLTTALWEPARARAQRRALEVRESLEDVVGLGATVAGIDDLGDEDVFAGFSEQLFATALGELVIVSWEGVGAEEGDDAAPVTPDYVAAFMADFTMKEAFMRKYLVERRALEQEGNGSAPSSPGSSAKGATTAKTAKTSSSRARKGTKGKTASAARTSRKNPKRSKGSPPGGS
nr:hypothetical protein 5 [bacterium]